ncbi:PadR family transcriptional regulator [Bacillus cereus]|uniref:PadR family transcriptional regulator n=1 Tax=Bacillus cereus TaxID=1396 RepID=UPI00356E1A3B
MRLMVLGLLTKNNLMSGYEIQQALQMVQSSKWVEVFPASIYYALKKMENEELIEIATIEKTGKRSKTVYCITVKGKREFKSLLKNSFQKNSVVFPKDLYTALTFLSEEPSMKEEIVVALQAQKGEILCTYEEMKVGEKLKNEVHMPEYVNLIFENIYEQCEVQLRLIHKLEKMLRS